MMFRETVANGGITWTPGQGLCIDEDLVEVTQPSIDDGVGSMMKIWSLKRMKPLNQLELKAIKELHILQ